MNLNNVYTLYKEFEKLYVKAEEDYATIMKKEGKDVKDLERIAKLEFTPEEKETIALLSYTSSEMMKLKETALFADYFGLKYEEEEEFKRMPGFNLALSTLTSPLIIVEEGEIIVNNEDEWTGYIETQVDNLKQHLQQIQEMTNEGK